MKSHILFFIHILLITIQCFSQQVTGLWGVTEVKVGERTVTPVAKWFHIEENKTYQAGNGWLQNDTGQWAFDAGDSTYYQVSDRQLTDKYGAFRLSFGPDQMYWRRLEDGLPVVVILQPIRTLPMAPADSIHGLWQLDKVIKDQEDITKPFDAYRRQYLFIGWDRLYRMRAPDGKMLTGYWHIDSHQSRVNLIPFDREIPEEVFLVSFAENSLIMKSDQEDMIFNYRRIREFPE